MFEGPTLGKMSLGRMTKELRTARGWSQRRLSDETARVMGNDRRVQQTLISHLEIGRIKQTSFENIQALAAAFGVRVELLLQAAGALSPESGGEEPGALTDLVTWLESRADLVELLEEVRKENEPEVYQEFLAGVAQAWEANIKMASRQFQLGGSRGNEEARGRP